MLGYIYPAIQDSGVLYPVFQDSGVLHPVFQDSGVLYPVFQEPGVLYPAALRSRISALAEGIQEEQEPKALEGRIYLLSVSNITN